MSIELPERKNNLRTLAAVAGAAALVFGGLGLYAFHRNGDSVVPERLLCEQPPALVPDFDARNLEDSQMFYSKSYKKYSRDVLAGAVRIPTVSYDDMLFNVTDEPRFRVFNKLHAYLAKEFPLLHKYHETVNTYGLLYTLPGKNASLKPLVLMAHQDVVPVAPETLDEWTHPPFEAVTDDEWLYGRGSCDCKNTLISIYEAVEALLRQHWHPERTLILSFGFDEEISGFRGAKTLAETLEERYGTDSVELLVDEGLGVENRYDRLFAVPAVGEKGRVNLKFTLKTPGGHSSAPPDHTGIGIIADLVTKLEGDAPLPATLGSENVAQGMFSCFAKHGSDLDASEKLLFGNLQSPAIASELASVLAGNQHSRVLVETTQAIDIIRGGVKINALPEEVVVEANYRVKPDSSVKSEVDRVLNLVHEVAETYKLSANFSDTTNASIAPRVLRSESKANGFLLTEITDKLDVAPISPYYNSSHWDVLSGTVIHALESAKNLPNSPVIVSPSLMTGNTDTAHYWSLTKSLYRFSPALSEDLHNMHTVDEAIRLRSHYATVAFFYEFVLNLDGELPHYHVE